MVYDPPFTLMSNYEYLQDCSNMHDCSGTMKIWTRWTFDISSSLVCSMISSCVKENLDHCMVSDHTNWTKPSLCRRWWISVDMWQKLPKIFGSNFCSFVLQNVQWNQQDDLQSNLSLRATMESRNIISCEIFNKTQLLYQQCFSHWA